MPALTSPARRAWRHLLGQPLPTPSALWQGGGRRGVTAAACAVLPLIVGVSAGEPGLGAAGALGAFTAIYGHALPYRRRAVVVAGVALAMTVAAWLGALTGPHPVVLALVCGGLAAVATVATAVWRIGAPGPAGFVIVCGGSSALGTAPGEHALAAGAAAALAWVGCMLPWLWDRTGPERRAVEQAERAVGALVAGTAVQPVVVARDVRLADTAMTDAGRRDGDLRDRLRLIEQRFFEALPTDPDVLPRPAVVDPTVPPPTPRWWHRPWVVTAARTGIGVAAAGLAAAAVGLHNTYWAATSAAAVLAGIDARQAGSRALHRAFGTVLGVLLAGAIIWADPPVAVSILLVGLMQLTVELLIAHRYWMAVSLITPLVLTLVHMALPQRSVGELVVERLSETGIGIVVALAVGLALFRRSGSRRLPAAVRATAAAALALTAEPGRADVERHLHDALVALSDIALVARAELSPAPATAAWLHQARHVADLGWALLGARARGEDDLTAALTRRIREELAHPSAG
ncbi:FUSC family protein [Blastococcus mobilis]|uniref:FUSC family protein n=1 Tax=Blastococcus mobilis TaxID=1938746 RepID=UPI00113213CB|nr:FUSC family protein [Blastococcus mobilis]